MNYIDIDCRSNKSFVIVSQSIQISFPINKNAKKDLLASAIVGEIVNKYLYPDSNTHPFKKHSRFYHLCLFFTAPSLVVAYMSCFGKIRGFF